MSDDGAVSKLLEERPDLADPLEAVVSVDAREETWTFDDVPVNSGPFGELVSRGVVERDGDTYRVADPAAVRAALGGRSQTDGARLSRYAVDIRDVDVSSFARPTIDRTTGAIIAATIAFVGLVRVHPFRSVYREGNVVLSGNDPYFYRYHVEQAVASGAHVFDLSALTKAPGATITEQPLMVASLWWVAELLGDGPAVVGDVLAWYPVVSAVVTALFVYLLTVTVTGDRRIGIAAVLVLALIPGHALRTSLGFADHHAFDYPWLVATAFFLARITSTDRSDLLAPRTTIASLCLGVAVAGQVLAWDAAPLLIAPVGLIIAGKAVTDVRDGRSPLRRSLPILGGFAVASVLTAAVHTVFGWQSTFVAFAPGLVFAGSIAVLSLAEIVHRTTGDVRQLVVVNVVFGVIGFLVFRTALPSFWDTIRRQLDLFFSGSNIAESLALFSPQSFGFIFLFGFTLVLALPAMVLGIRFALDDDRWLVTTVYAWYFMLLASYQVRFVGELAAFASVFAGFGLVWIAAWIDATAPIDETVERLHLPDRNRLFTLFFLFLLFGSLGAVQVPVKTSQVTIEDGEYHSAQFIAERSERLGQTYPENYVFSSWGHNRMYNYFVNGESESYAFAQNNFDEFLKSHSPGTWYNELENRAGYVVVDPTLITTDEKMMYLRLTHKYGSPSGDIPGTPHFRALYLPPDRSKIVFSIVPGANVTGTVEPNATVTMATPVSIPRARFTYEARTTADANGTFSQLVSQPGTYQIQAGDETRRVTVSEAAVRNGTTVEA